VKDAKKKPSMSVQASFDYANGSPREILHVVEARFGLVACGMEGGVAVQVGGSRDQFLCLLGAIAIYGRGMGIDTDRMMDVVENA
jgi:hypothetical protein